MQTVTYQLTVADLVDGRSYAYNNLPSIRGLRLIIVVLTLGCVPFGGYLALLQDWSGLSSLVGWFLGGLALIAWMFLGNRWLLPGAVRRQLTRSNGLRGDIVASWDTDCITLEGSHGLSRWPWSDFYRWQESPGGVLLWQSEQIYNYLPKRVLTDDQVSELRSTLSETLGKPGKRSKASAKSS